MYLRTRSRVTCTFKQAYQNYIKNQIIDKNMQRRLRWSTAHFSEFLAAGLKGNTTDPFLYADLSSSLVATKEQSDAFGIKTLSSFIKKGKTVSNLDSQNRTTMSQRLVENKITITGTFVDKDGVEVEVENQYFKDLPQRLKDAIWDMELDITILYGRPYAEHGQIFRGKNDGYPPTAQENRNSFATPLAHEIRSLAESHQDALKRVHTIKKQFDEMKDLEFVAKILASLLPNLTGKMRTLNKAGLDSFYTVGEGRLLSDTVEYEGLDRAKAIIGMVADCLKQSGEDTTKIPDCQLWALTQVCEHLYSKQAKIVAYKNVYEAIKICDQNLFNQSKIQQGKDLNNAIVSFSTNEELKPSEVHKKASETCKDSQYYWWQRGNQDAPNNRERRSNQLIGYFRTECLVELVKNGSITTESNQLDLPMAA